MEQLPSQYADVEDIMQKMPMTRRDGSPGLLARGEFGDYVKSHLRMHDLSNIQDPRVCQPPKQKEKKEKKEKN